MYHTLEFVEEFIIDVAMPRKHRLEQMLIKSGMRVQARIKPFVREGIDGPLEMADLHFNDGSVMRTVRFSTFVFVN